MRPLLHRLGTLALCCWLLAVSTVSAQTRKPVQQKARTTQTKQQPKSQPKAKTTTQKPKAKTPAQPTTVKGLQNQRQQLQKQLKEQQLKLEQNRKKVKQRLQNLQIINTEIVDKQKTIDTIRHDIDILDDNIAALNIQLNNLEARLQQRKDNYMKSMRYMHRNRSVQNQLMFIFSAQNFTQMYRRMRFTREYAQYQRAQGEAVKIIQEEVRKGQEEMTASKQQKSDLLSRGEQERRNLENKQAEQQKVVKTLEREQKTIESVISEQRKKDAALNAQIEKLIAEEIARAKARAEAEAKRKAAEEAARKRAEELARKKAAAEAAARENARRVAEAKAREEQAKQQALAAKKKSAEEKAAADRAAKAAEQARRAAEQRAADEAKAHEREIAEAKKDNIKIEKADFSVSTEDRRLSGNFESNRGRLPMPITGNYRIVSGFGQNSVDGLKGVRLDNKGMNIKGNPGAQARSIFDGEVCAVFDLRGVMGVMVRHGSYISVYSNLSSVSVRRGQKVTTRQTLGTINTEGILHFQLRKGSATQNPASWLAR